MARFQQPERLLSKSNTFVVVDCRMRRHEVAVSWLPVVWRIVLGDCSYHHTSVELHGHSIAMLLSASIHEIICRIENASEVIGLHAIEPTYTLRQHDKYVSLTPSILYAYRKIFYYYAVQAPACLATFGIRSRDRAGDCSPSAKNYLWTQ